MTSLFPEYTVQQLKKLNDDAARVSITLRRFGTPLDEQLCYLVLFSGSPRVRQTKGGKSHQVDGEVRGEASMDVAVEDRFTYLSSLFQVVFIRRDPDILTVAEVEIVQ